MPYRIPKEIHDPLCNTVGEFVTHWAMVERGIDFCIAIIYQRAGGKHIENEIPKALGKRIKFLRRCFNRLSVLSPHADEARSLLGRISALTNTRHMLVHGCLSSYISDENRQEFHFVKIDLTHDKQMHVSNSLRVTGLQLTEDISEAFSLATSLIDFTDRLLQSIVPEYEPDELFRHV